MGVLGAWGEGARGKKKALEGAWESTEQTSAHPRLLILALAVLNGKGRALELAHS